MEERAKERAFQKAKEALEDCAIYIRGGYQFELQDLIEELDRIKDNHT